MFGTRKAPKRFSLLLLEEGEDYVEDWVAEVRWPTNCSGNWQGLPKLQGRLRLCSKSIFFEPDDVRSPIVRCSSFCYVDHPTILPHVLLLPSLREHTTLVYCSLAPPNLTP